MNTDPVKELQEYIISSGLSLDQVFGLFERLEPIIKIMYEHGLTHSPPVLSLPVGVLDEFRDDKGVNRDFH